MLKEKENGSPHSGWKYLLNGSYPDVGLYVQPVSNGDVIVWHYVNDWGMEDSAWLAAYPNIPVLTGISVTTMPTKTTYNVGETLDLRGLLVTASYQHGAAPQFNRNSSSASFAPDHNAALNTAGTQTITVTFQGQTTTFNVTVNGPVNNAALLAKITEAQNALGAISVGDGNGQYPQSAVDALNSAITSAQAIANKSNRTAAEVANALQSLQNAIDVFDGSVTVISVDKSALTALIATAAAKINGATAGTAPGQYPQSAVNALADAISDAQDIADDARALQSHVNNAVTALQNAIIVFDSAKIPEPTAVTYQIAKADVLNYIRTN
ncbi:MAG: bacterial Ig-like domain-containing protein, partial [Oscillospiraceae bacterium]|nr:bacterial Ig-like domain-containing protein [Oscillospiraceae bacterium]